MVRRSTVFNLSSLDDASEDASPIKGKLRIRFGKHPVNQELGSGLNLKIAVHCLRTAKSAEAAR